MGGGGSKGDISIKIGVQICLQLVSNLWPKDQPFIYGSHILLHRQDTFNPSKAAPGGAIRDVQSSSSVPAPDDASSSSSPLVEDKTSVRCQWPARMFIYREKRPAESVVRDHSPRRWCASRPPQDTSVSPAPTNDSLQDSKRKGGRWFGPRHRRSDSVRSSKKDPWTQRKER